VCGQTAGYYTVVGELGRPARPVKVGQHRPTVRGVRGSRMCLVPRPFGASDDGLLLVAGMRVWHPLHEAQVRKIVLALHRSTPRTAGRWSRRAARSMRPAGVAAKQGSTSDCARVHLPARHDGPPGGEPLYPVGHDAVVLVTMMARPGAESSPCAGPLRRPDSPK
jgi:hypothetical protein